MKKNEKEPTISDSLKVIKKALEDDGDEVFSENDILVLDRLVKEDGTIININKGKNYYSNLTDNEVTSLIDKKIDEKFNKYLKKKNKLMQKRKNKNYFNK